MEEKSDDELVRLVRGGDDGSFGVLWRRHYKFVFNVAYRYAKDPDDIVSEAFLRTLNALRCGKGPDAGFRPYILRAVRNIAANLTRDTHSQAFDNEVLDLLGNQPGDDEDRRIDAELALLAFTALPIKWQEIIWQRDIQKIPPRILSVKMSVPVAEISAMVYRAHERLRQEWIRVHLSSHSQERDECSDAVDKLPAYVRNKLSAAPFARVSRHLERCHSCADQLGEALRVNRILSRGSLEMNNIAVPAAV